MPKFQPGDEVICLHTEYLSLISGRRYTVLGRVEDQGLPLLVLCGREGRLYWPHHFALAPVKEPTDA